MASVPPKSSQMKMPSGSSAMTCSNVAVAGTTEVADGTVEDVTLRITRLRSSDGEVINIPNGQIVKATNLSKDWARAVVDIPLPAAADIAARIPDGAVLVEFADYNAPEDKGGLTRPMIRPMIRPVIRPVTRPMLLADA